MKMMLGLMLALLSTSVFAQGEKPGLRKEMEEYFAKVDRLIVAGNVNGYLALLAPEYYTADTEGKRMEKAAYRQMITGMAAASKVTKSWIRVKNVQYQDQEAVVWIQHEMTWKEKSGSGWVSKKSTTRWAENLKQTPQGWKIKSSQQLMTNEPWTFKTNG